jgi:hypothetical protein
MEQPQLFRTRLDRLEHLDPRPQGPGLEFAHESPVAIRPEGVPAGKAVPRDALAQDDRDFG